LTAEIAVELDSAAGAEPMEQAPAGAFGKPTLIAIAVLQLAWASALLMLVASVIR
jgi:hypothetical protein